MCMFMFKGYYVCHQLGQACTIQTFQRSGHGFRVVTYNILSPTLCSWTLGGALVVATQRFWGEEFSPLPIPGVSWSNLTFICFKWVGENSTTNYGEFKVGLVRIESWEPKGTPPMPRLPPGNSRGPLLRDYENPLVSLNKAGY